MLWYVPKDIINGWTDHYRILFEIDPGKVLVYLEGGGGVQHRYSIYTVKLSQLDVHYKIKKVDMFIYIEKFYFTRQIYQVNIIS